MFINGCGTAAISPSDVLTFVDTFMWCQAAGVIGTEIPIPEFLATEFAINFFTELAQPKAEVCEVIWRERMALMAKYNLLGLAYTPYCHANLGFRSLPAA